MGQLGAGYGSSFPSAVDTAQTYANTTPALPDDTYRIDAEVINDILDALIKIETALKAHLG